MAKKQKKPPAAAPSEGIRDRVKELRRVPAGELLANPKNWRLHPPKQRAVLEGLLAEVGYADALIARELPDGTLELIDGHLRAETTPDAVVPVLILDVSESEADKILTTLDPLAAMAEIDDEKLRALLDDVQTGSQDVAEMLDSLAQEAGILSGDPELTELSTRKQPVMSWVLIGIPTVRYGDIAAHIEAIAAIEDSFVETAVNDG